MKEGLFHSFSSQLKITQTPFDPLEEKGMLGDIFEIMAMVEDYLEDPMHLIKPVEEKKPMKKPKKKTRNKNVDKYV